MSDYEVADIRDQIQKLKRERQPLDLDRAIKNNDVIKILTSACLKIDDPESQKGILQVIANLTDDNLLNLDYINNEHWMEKS